MEVRFKTPVTLAKSLPPFKSISVAKVWMFQFRWHATIWIENKKYFVTQTPNGFDVTENGKPKNPVYQGTGKDFQKWIVFLAANTRR
jgi:hypothetical protein